MIVPIELALPCQLVKLDLRVDPSAGATTLEDLVAQGILAWRERQRLRQAGQLQEIRDPMKENTTGYLSWLLALPERVIVDVVGSLWSKGYVTVDFENGNIELSEAATSRLATRRSLAADGEIRTREFLFEPITGLIYQEKVGYRSPNAGSVKLPLRHRVRKSDLPQAELVRSVQSALRRDRAQAGRINVLDVSFGNPILQDSFKLRWLHVNVAAYRDPQTDDLSITLDEALLWTAGAQRQLRDYLAKLAAEEPDHPAIQQLLGRARVDRAPPRQLNDLIARMRERVAGLDSIHLSQVKEGHRVLTVLTEQIRDQLSAARAARASVTLVTRVDGHQWAVNDLIEKSRSQIVLVAPTLEYDRMREILKGLRDALDRGVQLVVLWGRTRSDKLPQRTATLLDELERRKGARVLRAPRSSMTDACVVIQDDCRALLSSHSLLGTRGPGEREAAILVEPADDGPLVPLAVAHLLDWARNEFPRWVLGQRIELAQSGSAAGSGKVDPLDEQPLVRIDAEQVDASTIPLWAASWRETFTALMEARAEVLAKSTTVEVVRDQQHRALLLQRLQGAGRRLIIADDRIDARSANASIARTIRERQTARVSVQIIHPAIATADRQTGSFALLSQGPNRVPVRTSQDSGRVVVADDEILLGSYSPLGERRSSAEGQRISQLGLSIRSEELAAELGRRLGAVPAETPEPSLAPSPSNRSRLATEAALPLLLEARALGGAEQFGRVVAERLRTVDEPFAVLTAWRRDKVPVEEMRTATAAVLAEGIQGRPEVVEVARRWLVEDAWRRGAFVEAALLAQRLNKRPGPLDGSAVMAAALEIGPLGETLSDAAIGLHDQHLAARCAGAAGALAEVLLWNGAEGPEVLRMLAPALPENWRAFCERVHDFQAAPLPLSELLADQTRANTLRILDERRLALVSEIDKVEALRTRFDFGTGTALHTALLTKGGLLDVVRTAARTGVPECQDLVPNLPVDVRAYLNDVIARTGEKPMEWLKQIRFLHRIEDIIRWIRTIGATAPSTLTDDGNFRPDILELGRFLAGTWDALYAEARARGPRYELPMLALLDKMNPLVVLAQERS